MLPRFKQRQVINMSLNHYAKFTKVYADVLRDNPDILDNFTLDTTEHTSRFKEVFNAKYALLEISLETVDLFKEAIDNRFIIKKDYYIELINAYETRINMLDGLVTTKSGESESSESNSSTFTPGVKSQSTNYDLPRSTASQEHASNKTISEILEGEDTTEGSRSLENEYGETTKSANAIDQKKKYMKMLRNVYEEFAREFYPCFLDMYE